MRFNVEKLKERGEALRIERELDLAFLDAVLKKEAAQEASENAKKAAYAEAAAQYRVHLKALMVQEGNDEEMLDQLRNAELEKAWGKRTAVWVSGLISLCLVGHGLSLRGQMGGVGPGWVWMLTCTRACVRNPGARAGGARAADGARDGGAALPDRREGGAAAAGEGGGALRAAEAPRGPGARRR